MTSADLIANIVVAFGIVFMGIIAVVPLVIDHRPRPRRRVPAATVLPAPRPPSRTDRSQFTTAA